MNDLKQMIRSYSNMQIVTSWMEQGIAEGRTEEGRSCWIKLRNRILHEKTAA